MSHAGRTDPEGAKLAADEAAAAKPEPKPEPKKKPAAKKKPASDDE